MKKIVGILLVVATLLNIGAGAFIFGDIQTMQLPETTLKLELLALTSDEAVLQTNLSVNNPNSFSLFIQDLTVTTMTDNGEIINYLFIEGGEIHGYQNKTFTATEPVRFNGTTPSELTSRISGTVGIIYLGIIKKTLPLTFSMITSLNNIINQFTLPHVSLGGNFSDITQEGVNFTGYITIANPYPFYIAVENLSMNMETETGLEVGTVLIQGNMIPAQTSETLTGSGRLLLKSLDAKVLHMTLKGKVILSIAGIKKSMNLSLDGDIIPPYLEHLFSDLPTDASLTGDYKLTVGGLLDKISFEVANPNKLTFLATDITVHIYRIDRNKTRLMSNGTLLDGVITPQSTTRLQGDMLIPYSQLLPRFGERLFADRLQITMRANITIQGLNQTIWVGMIGYQDFPFHRLLSTN